MSPLTRIGTPTTGGGSGAPTNADYLVGTANASLSAEIVVGTTELNLVNLGSTLVGGTSTTSDLNLKTTSGVGTTGADIHFLTGNNGSREVMLITNKGNVGVGISTPGFLNGVDFTSFISLHNQYTTVSTASYSAISGGTSANGLIISQDNAVANSRLWVLGSQINGTSSKYILSAYDDTGGVETNFVTVLRSGNVGIGTTSPAGTLNLSSAGPTELYYDITNTASYSRMVFREGTTEKGGFTYIGSTFSDATRQGNFEIASQANKNIMFQGAGGSTKMTINTNTGNVGINQTNPGYKLDIAGSLNVSGNLLQYIPSTTPTGVSSQVVLYPAYDPTGGPISGTMTTIDIAPVMNDVAANVDVTGLTFYGTQYATYVGKLGSNLSGVISYGTFLDIGSTYTPAVSKVVSSATNIKVFSPAVAVHTITNVYGLDIQKQKVTGVTNGWGVYQEDTGDKNYFAGNVGIGTTVSPSGGGEILTVYKNVAEIGMQLTAGTGGGTVLNAIQGGGLQIYTHTGVVGSESYSPRVRIDNAGNVGIGTTGPSTKLEVVNNGGNQYNLRLTNDNTIGTAYQINASATGGRQYAFYSTANGAGQGGGNFLIYDETAGGGVAGTRLSINSNGGLAFGTYAGSNASAAPAGGMIISGNVGIGTTSPTNLLSLGGNSARTVWMERHTTANTAGNSLTVESGGATSAATDKNGGNLILKSGVATGTGSSNITFQTHPAGTTGTTDTTATTAMTILGSGNVGIGQTNPTSVLHLKAGTAAAATAPLKFTSGTLNTTAEAGAVEFLSDEFYGTITTGAARKKFAQLDKTLTGRLMVPMGEVNYFDTTGTSVTISAQSDGSSNMVVVAPTTTLNNDAEFDNGGANNGRLRYVGATTKTFHVSCTISFAAAGANDTFVYGVAKNGTVVSSSKILYKTINAGDTHSTALHVMVSLATNDYLELYVGNTTDADDLTIKTITLFAMGM